MRSWPASVVKKISRQELELRRASQSQLEVCPLDKLIGRGDVGSLRPAGGHLSEDFFAFTFSFRSSTGRKHEGLLHNCE